MTQRFSVSMSLSALSAGCPGENHLCQHCQDSSSARVYQNSTRRYNVGDRWVCSFEILNHLEKKTGNSQDKKQYPGWGLSLAGTKMVESYNLSLLVFIVVVSKTWPYGPNSKETNWQEMSAEQFSTSCRRRHCFVSIMWLKSVMGVCSQGNRNNMNDDEINVL